jgi:hypothetical protein
LKGLSILVIDDDRLAAFRLHKALVAAGARVASGDLAMAAPYLEAAALAAVVLGAGLNAKDACALLPKLSGLVVPWLVVGDGGEGWPPSTVRVPAADLPCLVTTLAAMCAPVRH